ncbi:MAG: MFS transporter [Lentisphaeria bacterium]|nr:MFS transporter [Lentisphaeria bacterium]
MDSSVLSAEQVNKKKFYILICGVLTFFLTSMAKVLIPNTIFTDLQKLGLEADRISSLGAAFLYSYAASQLLIGCFSDRYGGVRVLLIGGSLFSAGTIIFPLLPADQYYLMIFFRLMTGFGAGTIFLGVAKLLGDLYSEKFGIALGCVLFISYLGPTTGTLPMVKLVETIGWKPAMILPGILAAIAMIIILSLKKGTIKPVMAGQNLAPLFVMLKSRSMWFLCFSCATVYGAYYSVVGQIGNKAMSDIFHIPSRKASMFLMILTLIVALNNMGGNLLLKLFGGCRKLVLITGVIASTVGVSLAYFGFRSSGGAAFFIASGVLLAFPAGFFPMFSIVAKEINKPEHMGMAVAFLNFMAFVFISLYQNIVGWILKGYPVNKETLAFPVEAYTSSYLFFMIGAAVSLIAVFFVPETKKGE